VSGQFDDREKYCVNGSVAPTDENCAHSIPFFSVLRVYNGDVSISVYLPAMIVSIIDRKYCIAMF